MTRRAADLLDIALLDEAAEIHHPDGIGHVLDQGQVMSDDDVGQGELGLEVGQQVDDLRLDRYVERADRLVEDEHLSARR